MNIDDINQYNTFTNSRLKKVNRLWIYLQLLRKGPLVRSSILV